MLNFKKGLALVLAAATAITFAPFTGFGVTANAAIGNSGSIATPGATTVTVATPSATDTFGGINTNLIVTDNTSYSFVNENATFVKDGTKYTADQLKWYLTTAPNSTPTNMTLTSKVAVINDSGENGTVGKLNVTVANATDFANNTDGKAYVEGVYWNGAANVIVYNQKLNVTAAAGKTIQYTASDSVKGSDINNNDVTKPWSTKCLEGLGLIGVNNKFLKDDYSVDTTVADIKQSGKNFEATIAQATASNAKTLEGSVIKANNVTGYADGIYYETLYVPYQDNAADANNNGYFIAEISVTIAVSAGPTIDVKDGKFSYVTGGLSADDRVITLDLATNKTFDIKAHTVSNMDNTTYEYSVDTQNVTVSKDGVATAAKVGTATVTITPTAGGVKGTPVKIYFRVNQTANDNITVTGKDGDVATVLDTRQFHANDANLTSEKKLAAAQVGYIQIEATGNEPADVKEAITVKGAGKLTFSLASDAATTSCGATVDSKTGVITIAHSFLNKTTYDPINHNYVFAVKVVSSETTTSALTTGYFYVVVDYPDATITGLESSYEVGTCAYQPDDDSWLKLGNGDQNVISNARSYYVTTLSNKSDALDESKLYADDSINSFENVGNSVSRGLVSGKTEHLLVETYDYSLKIGKTYRVVEVKSVAGKSNYVTKIVNVADGKTIYEADGATSGAAITIDKKTVVKVTVAYAPDKSLNPKKDPAFTIGGRDDSDDGFNHNTTNVFVAATENPKTYEVTLVPSIEGTQIVYIYPTQGRLSKSDYSLVDRDWLAFAVKYDSKAVTTKPAKVTGVKVTNKKGAKVTVKFNKVKTAPTIRYYVQKKIGKKVSGKSIGSTKTTLSVAKGKTIKVRVKAYYYDENGKKHVGKYSSWKTLKTDKK